MTVENGRPQKPSDQLFKFLRFIDPTDPTKIIEIKLVKVAGTTPDGHDLYAVAIASPGGGTLPTVPGTTIHGGYQLPDALIHQLPTVTLVNSISLVASQGNAGTIWVGGNNTTALNNGVPLEPGESIPIDALNLDQLWVIGTLNDRIFWIGG